MTHQSTGLDAIHLADVELASAVVQSRGEAEWWIESQNDAALAIWGDYDISQDISLRLSLLEADKKRIPSSFLHKIPGNIQSLRFIVTPYQGRLLVQFFPDFSEHHSEDDSIFDFYETVLEASHNGVFDFNLTDETVKYSRNVHEICGVTVSDLGRTKSDFFKRIHPDDIEAVDEALEMHLETAWPFEVEFRFKTATGIYIWLQSCGKAIKDSEDDDAVRFVGNLVNISERKFVEDMVKQREQLVEQIIDSLPISIYVKDDKGCFRFFSEQTEKDTGIDRAMAIGKTDYEIFPIEQARQSALQDQQVVESGRLMVTEEPVQLPNGECRWLMQGKGPITIYEDDSVKNWLLGFSLDITERKLAEDLQRDAKIAAEEAVQTKSEFLSVMSHEIRTPLNSVIGTAQLLQDMVLEDEQKHYVDMIRHSGEHLLQLINDILDFNKLEANKVELESAAFDLSTLVGSILDMNRLLADKKGLKLSEHYSDGLSAFYLGDAARVRQILLNLVGNALKFTSEGEISIRVRPTENKRVRFEVTDSGIGIRPEQIDKLFSAFTQADASTTRQFGGTGLGLSICKKLVDMMGGDIGIDSEYGQGSTFWFELPLVPAKAPEKPVEVSPEMETAPLNILVAEDNLPNQLLVKAILSKLGHQVLVVGNGLEAVQSVETAESPFDVVLMDMQMPEMDGLTATQHIRELPSSRASVPIIALTANALSGDREKVLDAGMNDYLTKPIDVSQLKRLLNVWGTANQRLPGFE